MKEGIILKGILNLTLSWEMYEITVHQFIILGWNVELQTVI